MTIERHPSVVEDDLPGIFANIARDNPAAAERVLDAVAVTFDHLAAQAEIGVLYLTRNPQLKELRMLPVSGFHHHLVFYRIADDAVRLLYVVHGARHLGRWFGRERRE